MALLEIALPLPTLLPATPSLHLPVAKLCPSAKLLWIAARGGPPVPASVLAQLRPG